MNTWIRLMSTMDGFSAMLRERSLARGLTACALVAPLALAGCAKTTETQYIVAPNQTLVPLTLDNDIYRLTFFGMKQNVQLALTAPMGTTFVINGAKTYHLPLAVGQQQNVYFDVQSDGRSADGAPTQRRRISLLAEGYERPSAAAQSFETRLWSKAPNHKPYTPHLLGVQYRYALAATQRSMQVNLGNFRHDPKSHFIVQGGAAVSHFLIKAAPGEAFVFAPKGATFEKGEKVPSTATSAQEYRIEMKPGQDKAFELWSSAQGVLRPNIITVQYSFNP